MTDKSIQTAQTAYASVTIGDRISVFLREISLKAATLLEAGEKYENTFKKYGWASIGQNIPNE
jgi:hypothetical protein